MNRNEIVVFITVPNEEEGANIARTIIHERLAACVNIIKGIRSLYRWQGKIEDDSEVLMIVKTKKSLFKSLSARIKEIHSYSVPEVIALPIVDGLTDYINWIHESTKE